jgi:hypothetical protein
MADARARRNRRNGTTALGRALARRAGCRLQPGPLGTLIAERYRWPLPDATCFVVGDVIFCRHSARWLLAEKRDRLLRHEIHHTYQYAGLGLAFLPLYAAGCAWSYLLTGDVSTHNTFERRAGLADGGYSAKPLRPALRRLGSRPISRHGLEDGNG